MEEDISPETITAIRHLYEKGIADSSFPKAVDVARSYRASEKDHSLQEWAAKFLHAIELGKKAGRLKGAEAFYLTVFPIETIHEERFLDGTYDAYFDEVNREIEEFRVKYGLEEDEYWLIGEGPDEWVEANNRYDEICNDLFNKTLIEFGAKNLAELHRRDADEFRRRLDRGREIFLGRGTDKYDSLVIARDQFYEESKQCAEVGAYRAACVMLGSTIEATLLALCYKKRDMATAAARKLPKKARPSTLENPDRWTFAQLIDTANAAGWLPDISLGELDIRTEGLLQLVRLTRNFVHPGVLVRDKTDTTVSEQDYSDAESIYQVLNSLVIPRLYEADD